MYTNGVFCKGLNNDNNCLLVNGNEYIQCEMLDTGVLCQIHCNLDTKKMFVLNKSERDPSFQTMDMNGYKEKDIIDCSQNGDRWEGGSLNGFPYGFGTFFNENNEVIYTGFLFNYSYVCYGTCFYPDLNQIEYQGGLWNGMRSGYGSLYDKSGSLLYQGLWLLDAMAKESILSIPPHCDDERIVSSLITNLTIGNHSYNRMLNHLQFTVYPFLTTLIIGDCCFRNVDTLTISGCYCLESLKIGCQCFTNQHSPKRGEFSLTQCNRLKEVVIGCESFYMFARCTLQCRRLLSMYMRSSIIDTNLLW